MLVFFAGLTMAGYGQKVKYKDLFVLLNAHNYSEAEPYLRIFLAAEPDHPNANFHMGSLLQNRLKEINILTNTEPYGKTADSSVFYYERALSFITEKEIKKHAKDYYAAYKRRDMRSGKFEVKLSDVQLEIETRIARVKKNKENSLLLSTLVNEARRLYADCQSEYTVMSNQFENLPELHIMADQQLIDKLHDLMSSYDSSYTSMVRYAEIIKNKVLLGTKEIEKFKTDGLAPTDFYGEKVVFWDYKQWAGEAIKVINEEILPLKKRLISYDTKLSELYDRVIADSLDVRSRVFELATETVSRDLRAYDANSLPASLFNFRIAELNYLSTYFNWLQNIADSADVGYKFVVLNEMENQLNSLRSLFEELRGFDDDKTRRKYDLFFKERYGSYGGMMSYIADKEELILDQGEYLKEVLSSTFEEDKWGIWGSDRVPLLVGEQYVNVDSAITYSALAVDTVGNRTLEVFGFWRQETATGIYSALVPSSRQIKTFNKIVLDTAFGDREVSQIEYLDKDVEEGGRIWVVYVPNNDSLHSLTSQVIMLKEDAGLKWVQKFTITERPTKIEFNRENHILSVLGENQSILLQLDEFGDNKLASSVVNDEDINSAAQENVSPPDTTTVGDHREGSNQ